MHVFLLYKSVVRRTVEGIARALRDEPLNVQQAVSLALFYRCATQGVPVFISTTTLHILQNLDAQREVQIFLKGTRVLYSTRYVRRWARRLREHGFTREDALLLSLATFGTDEEVTILGVSALLTLDLALINNFVAHRGDLERRLQAMISQLHLPYRRATLPHVWQPLHALSVLSS